MSACQPCAERAPRLPGRIAVLLLCCVLLASCGFRKSRSLAEQGVTEFHRLFNREQYEAIYDQSDDSMKKSISRQDFVSYLRDIHSRLGNTRKTTTSGFAVNASPGQAANVELVQETEFDQGAAQERFLWLVKGGRAVLLGYRAEVQRSTGPRTVNVYQELPYCPSRSDTLFTSTG